LMSGGQSESPGGRLMAIANTGQGATFLFTLSTCPVLDVT